MALQVQAQHSGPPGHAAPATGAGSSTAVSASQTDKAALTSAFAKSGGDTLSNTVDIVVAGPVTPQTSPVIQQAVPMTQQSQLPNATAAASTPAAAEQGPLPAAPAVEQPLQAASGLPYPSQAQGTTAAALAAPSGVASPTQAPSGGLQPSVTHPSQGPVHNQLAPGSALQKQRLAMTDQSTHMGTTHSNSNSGISANNILVSAHPAIKTQPNGYPTEASLGHVRTGGSHPAGMQTSGQGATTLNPTFAPNQMPSVLSAAQPYPHTLPGHPVNSDFSNMFASQVAYQASQGYSGVQSAAAAAAAAAQAGNAANLKGLGSAQPTWPHANPMYSPRAATPGSGTPQQSSLPPGAQVTTPGTHPQAPSRIAQPGATHPSMEGNSNLQALARGSAMTNAHEIVPGMSGMPNAALSRTGTAWQVGLAAGLAATANMRPAPSSSLSQQAAATAAAARAAAAFQASRALSMAKGQSQPLLQGGVNPAVHGDQLFCWV